MLRYGSTDIKVTTYDKKTRFVGYRFKKNKVRMTSPIDLFYARPSRGNFLTAFAFSKDV